MIVPGAQGPQGNAVQFPDSHWIPTWILSEFPRIAVSGRALDVKSPRPRSPPGRTRAQLIEELEGFANVLLLLRVLEGVSRVPGMSNDATN